MKFRVGRGPRKTVNSVGANYCCSNVINAFADVSFRMI